MTTNCWMCNADLNTAGQCMNDCNHTHFLEGWTSLGLSSYGLSQLPISTFGQLELPFDPQELT